MAAIKEMYFDIYKQPSLTPIIYGRVGDGGTQTVKVYLTEDNEVIDLKKFTITFEGNTSGNKTVIMDTDGVSNINYTEGSFSYTFPNMTFGVSGEYERAYFSITNAETKERSTTSDFKIIVFDNADITAEEGITVITEYNKLVEELHKLQAKNIADLEDELKDIKTNIISLQNSIVSYKTSVEKTATDAKNSINTSTTAAVKTINDTLVATQTKITAVEKDLADAVKKFNDADFYTKAQIDSKLSTIEVTKEKVGLGNVNNYKTATNESAIEGTSSTEYMTPSATKAAVDSRVATDAQVTTGTDNSNFITPKILSPYTKYTQGEWINITMGTDLKAADNTTPRYRVDTFTTGNKVTKHVLFTGAITGSGGTLAGKGSQYVVFVLPDGARPELTVMKPLQTNKLTVTSRCAITNAGTFYIGYDGSSALDYVYIDSMDFWI